MHANKILCNTNTPAFNSLCTVGHTKHPLLKLWHYSLLSSQASKTHCSNNRGLRVQGGHFWWISFQSWNIQSVLYKWVIWLHGAFWKLLCTIIGAIICVIAHGTIYWIWTLIYFMNKQSLVQKVTVTVSVKKWRTAQLIWHRLFHERRLYFVKNST